MVPPILGRLVIIFSETRIGLCAHNVADRLSLLVAQSATKSATIFVIHSYMEERSFGYWLRLRRKALDLTQDGLADRVGCSVGMIRKIESEERRPSAQIVERLAEIFHIPSREQAAFLRFARGDWRSVPREIKETTPWHVSTQSPRSNIPASISSLVGREQAIADIRNYLSREDIRLVTLIGPPGIGKTRLSIETARTELSNFPDGVFFVALGSLDDPSLIALTIVQALGYVEAKNVPARQQLMDGIGGKQILIVLDNCEHLIEAVAPLTSDLLSACSLLKILATSRESMRVPGEWLYPVPELDAPKESSSIDVETASKFPALRLFAERARAVRPDFALNAENIQVVSSICAQLDGLPLAIELIAARMRLISPTALLEHWNAQFILSADGVRAVSTRQKTLNNAIAWSYNLLSEEEQKLFAYLSVFSGGFTLEAAESIFSGMFTTKSVSDLIVSLLDKSLLQLASDHKERRFNMLVTIQQFALDRLRRIGDEAGVRNWHLAYFLDLAEQANREIHGPAQVAWMDRLERELDNFRAALEWCVSNQKTEAALRMFDALGWSWTVRGHYSEMRSWFDQIRALPEIAAHPALYARMLNHIGRRYWLFGEYKEAYSILKESQAIWLKLGVEGERGLAEALVFLGMVLGWSEGDNQTAQTLYKQSLELYQKHNDQRGMALAIFNLAWIADARDDEVQALSQFEQSLDLYRQLGDVWGIARVSQRLGEFFLKQENYEKARLFFEQHLSLDESLGFRQGTAVALSNLGNLYRYQRDYDRARQFYEKSLDLCRTYAIPDWGYGLYCLGMLALQENDCSLAMQLFTEYFNSTQGFSDKISACDFFKGMAAIAAGTNRPERAARLQGAAQALFETTDYRIPPFDRAEFDRHIQIAREQLGEERFEALAAEGHAMSLEQAIDYALELSIYS